MIRVHTLQYAAQTIGADLKEVFPSALCLSESVTACLEAEPAESVWISQCTSFVKIV